MSEQEKVVRQILGRTVRCGGESHSGWLPKGAATPPQTPSRLVRLDFSIVQDGESSYLLQWVGPEPESTSDTWHESLEAAIQQAKYSFGVEPDEWQTPSD